MDRSRNIFALILSSLVLVVTIFALLAIWGLIPDIDWERLLKRGLWSLFVLFISSAIIMFIFNVLYKAPLKPPKSPNDSGGPTSP